MSGAGWRQRQTRQHMKAFAEPVVVNTLSPIAVKVGGINRSAAAKAPFSTSNWPSELAIKNLDIGGRIAHRDVKEIPRGNLSHQQDRGKENAVALRKKSLSGMQTQQSRPLADRSANSPFTTRIENTKNQVSTTPKQPKTSKLGYLMKKGQDTTTLGFKSKGVFQKRWFSLKDGVLSYYSEDKTTLKKVYPSFSEFGARPKTYEFYISVPNEKAKDGDSPNITVALQAASKSEMVSWLKALQNHIELNNNMSHLEPDLECPNVVDTPNMSSRPRAVPRNCWATP